MSTQVTGPVVAYIDRSTPTGCIAFAAAEAERRACGLVVVTLGALTVQARGELDSVRAAHPALATIADATREIRSDAVLVVTGGPNPIVATQSTGATLVVFLQTLAPMSPPAPVVVALDVEPANSVMEFAFEEALMRATSVRSMHIPNRLDNPVDPAVESSLRETLDRWADKYPGVPVRFNVVVGIDAGVALTVASRSAQLVVVGSAGADGPASVARTLQRRAGCPVAIVRG
jgi:hypothetical protein